MSQTIRNSISLLVTKLLAGSMLVMSTACVTAEADSLDESDDMVALFDENEPTVQATAMPADADAADADAADADDPDFTTNAVGCTWAGCNNKDPVLMGCTAGAVINSFAMISWGNTYYARVDAMYSPTCGSQWTRITNWHLQSPQALEASQSTGWLDALGIWQLTKFVIGAGGYVPYGFSINSPMMSASYSLRACGEWRIPGFILANCTGYY